ncbi:MAG: hypothetical protein IJP92_00655 [Lachnospiraceae bacterium]|nr:hypothetical protein [Lachnospiraceae bacterium]
MNMKIAIDIPEYVKTVIDRNGTNEIFAEALWQAVKNGTPLPKGHGRLLDERKMLERLKEWKTNDVMDVAHYNFTFQRIIESPTIIEADKERKRE